MSDADILTPKRSPVRRLTGVQIVGTGSYLPEKVVTNEALASLGCDADWIIQRTGIRERRHAPPEISTSDMAVAAGGRLAHAPQWARVSCCGLLRKNGRPARVQVGRSTSRRFIAPGPSSGRFNNVRCRPVAAASGEHPPSRPGGWARG